MNVTFIIIFCPCFIKRIEDEDEYFLQGYKINKREKEKKKVDIHLLATNAKVYFGTTFSATTI
jgi:hypothetical protein